MTNLVRTTPAAAVTFTSFELINRRLRAWSAAPSPAPTAAALPPAQPPPQQLRQHGGSSSRQSSEAEGEGALLQPRPHHRPQPALEEAAPLPRQSFAAVLLPDPRCLEAHFSRKLGGVGGAVGQHEVASAAQQWEAPRR